jgi:hypothetical protein
MPSLPPGWSWPLKSSEMATVFPGAGHVTRNGRPRGWQSDRPQPLVRVVWDPRSWIDQPMLTISAVPSRHRHALRGMVLGRVAAEVSDWTGAASSQGEGWQILDHSIRWLWTDGEGGLTLVVLDEQ